MVSVYNSVEMVDIIEKELNENLPNDWIPDNGIFRFPIFSLWRDPGQPGRG